MGTNRLRCPDLAELVARLAQPLTPSAMRAAALLAELATRAEAEAFVCPSSTALGRSLVQRCGVVWISDLH